jgi:hypothetical protein
MLCNSQLDKPIRSSGLQHQSQVPRKFWPQPAFSLPGLRVLPKEQPPGIQVLSFKIKKPSRTKTTNFFFQNFSFPQYKTVLSLLRKASHVVFCHLDKEHDYAPRNYTRRRPQKISPLPRAGLTPPQQTIKTSRHTPILQSFNSIQFSWIASLRQLRG